MVVDVLVKEKGIMFCADMVKAIVYDKTKTHTRRTSGLEKINKNPNYWSNPYCFYNLWVFYNSYTSEVIKCKPRYNVGDILYLKETYKVSVSPNSVIPVFYKVDSLVRFLNPSTYEYSSELSNGDELFKDLKWQSAMFMKRGYARHNRYEVVSVNPHRIQSITEAEVLNEGFKTVKDFAETVDRLNKKSKPWDNNSWVWDYGFKEME